VFYFMSFKSIFNQEPKTAYDYSACLGVCLQLMNESEGYPSSLVNSAWELLDSFDGKEFSKKSKWWSIDFTGISFEYSHQPPEWANVTSEERVSELVEFAGAASKQKVLFFNGQTELIFLGADNQPFRVTPQANSFCITPCPLPRDIQLNPFQKARAPRPLAEYYDELIKIKLNGEEETSPNTTDQKKPAPGIVLSPILIEKSLHFEEQLQRFPGGYTNALKKVNEIVKFLSPEPLLVKPSLPRKERVDRKRFNRESLRFVRDEVERGMADGDISLEKGFQGWRLRRWNERMLRQCISAIVEVASVAGFKVALQNGNHFEVFQIDRYVQRWFDQLPKELETDSWSDLVKYKLTAFFTSQFAEPDDQPSPGNLRLLDPPEQILGGRFYRWLYSLKMQHYGQYISFVQTLTSSKSLMPKLSLWKGDRAALETFKLLTTKKRPRDTTSHCLARQDEMVIAATEDIPLPKNRWLSEQSLAYQIDRTAKEVFGKTTLTETDILYASLPSLKATVDTKQSDGGALSDLQQFRPSQCVNINIEDYRFVGVDPEPYVTLEEKRKLETADELETLVGELRASMPRADVVDGVTFEDEAFRETFLSFLRNIHDHLPTDNMVTIQALYEALKMRCITKGTAGYNYLGKWLQRVMHSVMRKHPVFELIGKQVSSEVLSTAGKNRRPVSSLDEGEFWLSGDYKDATNQMRGWVCDTAFDSVCNVLEIPRELQGHLRKTLTKHTFYDPRFPGDRERSRSQTEGQLMGSILSFPFLCLINAAVLRWSMELSEGKTLRLWQCRLKVNGDDFLCPMTKYGRIVWRQIISFVGWSESQGKSYFSKRFAMINSRMFLPSPDGLEMVSQLKCGLMTGAGKTGSIGALSLENIGNAAKELVKYCPEEWRDAALSLFIKKHSVLLKTAGLRSWGLPNWVGGVGLPIPISTKDRRLALTVLLGFKIPEFIPEVPSTMHKQILSRLPVKQSMYKKVISPYKEIDFDFVEVDLETQYSQLYRELSVEIFLRRKLSQYFSASTRDTSDAYNKRLQRLLKRAFDGLRGGEGLTDWQLSVEKPSDIYPCLYKESSDLELAFPGQRDPLEFAQQLSARNPTGSEAHTCVSSGVFSNETDRLIAELNQDLVYSWF